MKKIIIYFIILSFLFIMTSCTLNREQFSLSNTSAVQEEENKLPLVPVTDIVIPAETTISNKEQIPMESNDKDPFVCFRSYSGGRGYFLDKVLLNPEVRFNGGMCPLVFFRVIGMEDYYTDAYSLYYVQITEVFGLESYDTDKVYKMLHSGTLQEQVYGYLPLEIGREYARIIPTSENSLANLEVLQLGDPIMFVEYCEGKRYLYSYRNDLSNIKCKIPIQDPIENSMYKNGQHDKAIACLKAMGQPLPTFDYKVEAEEYYAELVMRVERRIWERGEK